MTLYDALIFTEGKKFLVFMASFAYFIPLSYIVSFKWRQLKFVIGCINHLRNKMKNRLKQKNNNYCKIKWLK